ncbi:MAG: adenylate/guanylate cyclase domain-containing protein [Alphaproteobacteria bacterium]
MASKAMSVAILLADISGSTPLYKAIGDAEAQLAITRELQRLRDTIGSQGGVYVREKGDDVLAYFEDPAAAFSAMQMMVTVQSSPGLSIHAGLHFGQILIAEEDIFGEAVNLTARLSALANAGEGLLSRSVVDRLSGLHTAFLVPIDKVWLKGISEPLDVYSFTGDDTAMRTAMTPPMAARRLGRDLATGPEATLLLTIGDRIRSCREADTLIVGRSEHCDIVLPRPWISRRHARLSVRGGKAVVEDLSSSGTYVAAGGDSEMLLRREAFVLTGDGTISPALPSNQEEAEPIHFEVVRR